MALVDITSVLERPVGEPIGIPRRDVGTDPMATLLGAMAYLFYGNVALGGVMALAMILNLLLAASMGVAIPWLRARFGRDPAVGSSVLITARIAPRSRRCRVSARVPSTAMPTTPWRRSSSSRVRWARQLDGTRAGSRTT